MHIPAILNCCVQVTGNTPTGVGKTFFFFLLLKNFKKHPHGHGEDQYFTSASCNLVLSHLNSYIRREYSDIPAFDRFRAVYGPEILDRLGLTRIAPDDVILNPSLLKGKIMS